MEHFDPERLTPEALADYDDFCDRYGSEGNCYCHNSPPCGSCTHEGNPMNLVEDDTAWLPEEPQTDHVWEQVQRSCKEES